MTEKPRTGDLLICPVGDDEHLLLKDGGIELEPVLDLLEPLLTKGANERDYSAAIALLREHGRLK